MSYTIQNFKTKKDLKEAVKQYMEWCSRGNEARELAEFKGLAVRCYNPGLGPDLSNFTGKITLEGPHYPEPHRWYAQAELKDGIVIKVN